MMLGGGDILVCILVIEKATTCEQRYKKVLTFCRFDIVARKNPRLAIALPFPPGFLVLTSHQYCSTLLGDGKQLSTVDLIGKLGISVLKQDRTQGDNV